MVTTAAEIMTTPVVTVAPHASLAEIVGLMSSNNISAVAVCEPDGTFVGIVSEGDVLKPFQESVRSRREWWLANLAAGEALSQDFLDYVREDHRSAAEIMQRHVTIVTEATTVPEMAELMTRDRLRRLPVLRDGRVVGMVSRHDLVAAIARAPALQI